MNQAAPSLPKRWNEFPLSPGARTGVRASVKLIKAGASAFIECGIMGTHLEKIVQLQTEPFTGSRRPMHPFAPTGGEGARRADEGDATWSDISPTSYPDGFHAAARYLSDHISQTSHFIFGLLVLALVACFAPTVHAADFPKSFRTSTA